MPMVTEKKCLEMVEHQFLEAQKTDQKGVVVDFMVKAGIDQFGEGMWTTVLRACNAMLMPKKPFARYAGKPVMPDRKNTAWAKALNLSMMNPQTVQPEWAENLYTTISQMLDDDEKAEQRLPPYVRSDLVRMRDLNIPRQEVPAVLSFCKSMVGYVRTFSATSAAHRRVAELLEENSALTQLVLKHDPNFAKKQQPDAA